ncbi:MAG: Mut7-C RNAse domain-containing protein [Candidatus Bathyarchaeia archaeon]
MLDGMLGKLTRWLRILGHNVRYAKALDDETLIKTAKAEKRILLTRDVELYQRATSRHAEAFLVEGENEAERLASLSMRFDLSLEFNPNISRCSRCNTKIRPADKEEIGYKIPRLTKAFYQDFWECPKCGKVYWQGAHWSRITETLNEARRIQKKRVELVILR